MSQRFFVEPPIEGQSALLDGAEAHHLLHVMRARPGDEVTLFDGQGSEFTARVSKLKRGEVELEVLERQDVDRELSRAITLGVALPRGERQKWLVEKATELGVSQLVPLVTKYSVVAPGEHIPEKLRRAVIESAKQCGRNRLMRIGAPCSWQEFLTVAEPEALRLVAHPDDNRGGVSIPSAAPGQRVIIAIGPEGGLTETEVDEARRAGWQSLTLGPRILRVETAAIALIARYCFGDS